jgi:hypothetical protein
VTFDASPRRTTRLPEGGRTVKHRAAPVSVPAVSTVYVNGCKSGTIPDRLTGGDNNDYEHFGAPCGS